MKLITVTSDLPATERLITSAEKHGYDVVVLQVEWRGFGTKLIAVREYLLAHPNVSEFVFADAYDVVCMREWQELPVGIDLLLSAERGCWPDATLAERYGQRSGAGYDFVNSGLYYAKREVFMRVTEGVDYADDDQLWMTHVYLSGIGTLDRYCKWFQSYSFISEGDYSYGEELPRNELTGTTACWYHGNGRSDMGLLEKYL